ncbi:DUF5719 family protein [Microbacterium sp. C7(2022)]|uniref:DUF5719 family protein n=1 Tax=Microbacterium sp. C7(2022) TaxID=2992759 RepID=UPI00237BE28A|nr:DUF5719 family protein [Microbacterium sp. C7(2022)]MDE0547314.1 DUF5719 family protein [Microbacterium sp. C7(2022)]
MSDKRMFRFAGTSTRMLAGSIVSILAVVAVATAVTLPWPAITHEPVSVSARPAPAPTLVACTGGLLALGSDAEDAAGLALAARQNVTVGVGEGDPEPEEVRLESSAAVGNNGPSAWTAPPQDRVRTDVAASGSSTVSGSDLRGYAASACRPPLLESWLVGGSASTGAADLVLVSNPGEVAATVDIAVFGAEGMVSPPGGTQQVIPAGSQRVFPLAGLLLGEESPVIRVTATGAPVLASLQASITRTLVAGGVDQVDAIAQPSREQVIVGVPVAARGGDVDATESTSILRVLSPSADTTASITVSRTGSTEPATVIAEVPLPAGVPAAIDLGALPAAVYSVSVVAEDPVVAALWQSTGSTVSDDFAWFTSAPEVSTPTLFASPAGPAPVLTLVNDSENAADVILTSTDETYRLEVRVGAGQSTSVRLTSRTVYQLDPGTGAVRASLSMSGDGALAGFPVWGADAAARPITVYP